MIYWAILGESASAELAPALAKWSVFAALLAERSARRVRLETPR